MPGIFDHSCEQAVEVFMNLPEQPSATINEAGHRITSFSTSMEAAEQVVSELPPDEKAELVKELLGIDQEHHPDPYMRLDDDTMTFQEMLDRVLSGVIQETIIAIPEVLEREESNARSHEVGFET